jgi:hypothetical protein
MPKPNKQKKSKKEQTNASISSKAKKQEKKEGEKSEAKKKEEIVEEEKSLENEISDEEIQTQRFKNFSASISSSPVLEKIADAPETPDIDWRISESREEKKSEKKDYALLEEGVTEKYTSAEPEFAEAPVLRTERIDISSFQPEIQIGRKFAFSPVRELITQKEDYEAIRPSGDFEPGKEKEEIGRKYKPKRR